MTQERDLSQTRVDDPAYEYESAMKLANEYPWLAAALYSAITELHRRTPVAWFIRKDSDQDGNIIRAEVEILPSHNGLVVDEMEK